MVCNMNFQDDNCQYRVLSVHEVNV